MDITILLSSSSSCFCSAVVASTTGTLVLKPARPSDGLMTLELRRRPKAIGICGQSHGGTRVCIAFVAFIYISFLVQAGSGIVRRRSNS